MTIKLSRKQPRTHRLSYVGGTSAFQQVFNPAWVQASAGTNGKAGLLIRTQNCSATVGGSCVACSGAGQKASRITFSELLNNDNSSDIVPRFCTGHKQLCRVRAARSLRPAWHRRSTGGVRCGVWHLLHVLHVLRRWGAWERATYTWRQSCWANSDLHAVFGNHQ